MENNRDLFGHELQCNGADSQEPKLLSDDEKKAHKKALAAARQARYRASKQKLFTGEKNINMYLDYDAVNAMTRLCDFYGMTQKDLIAKLLCDADAAVAKKLQKQDTDKYMHYRDTVTRKLRTQP